jgi:hypothetical protein
LNWSGATIWLSSHDVNCEYKAYPDELFYDTFFQSREYLEEACMLAQGITDESFVLTSKLLEEIATQKSE